MLVLSCKLGERIVVPQCGLAATVLAVKGKVVRLGISAPEDLTVYREEILGQFHEGVSAELASCRRELQKAKKRRTVQAKWGDAEWAFLIERVTDLQREHPQERLSALAEQAQQRLAPHSRRNLHAYDIHEIARRLAVCNKEEPDRKAQVELPCHFTVIVQKRHGGNNVEIPGHRFGQRPNNDPPFLRPAEGDGVEHRTLGGEANLRFAVL